MNKKGIIIEIEGTDGSGKQTQTAKLYERLKKELDREILIQDFPNYDSESSGPVKMYLHGELGENAKLISPYQASALFAVDRYCTCYKEDGFYSKYKDGAIVLLDRYVGSNMIHQTGKIESKEEKDKFIDWVTDHEYNFLKLPKPDIVIFLDMPIECNLKLMEGRALKVGKKDIHEQDKTHLENAYKAGKYVANKNNWKIIKCAENVDNIKSIDEIHEEIFNIVKKYL